MPLTEKSFQKNSYYIIKQRLIIFICMKNSKFIFQDFSSVFDYFLRIFSHIRDTCFMKKYLHKKSSTYDIAGNKLQRKT